MKYNLVEELFRVFEKDKIVIKKNLLKIMNTIVLETKDKYGTLTMTIHYEKKENENE